MEKVVLYKFSGNFKQGEKWSKQDPSFRGEFIAKRDGRILGYCDELYDTEEEFKQRFIAGRFLVDGISFLKLSNSKKITPLLYSATNLDDDSKENALWAPVSLSTDLVSMLGVALGYCPLEFDVLDDPCPAQIIVERIEYSEEKEAEINKRLESFDESYQNNLILREHPEMCKFLKVSEDEEDECPEDSEDNEEET